MIKLNQLQDLLAVADKGGVRAGARHLGKTQPAISRSIREIERRIGAPLFERRAKGVVLTPIGERYVSRARVAANELRRAQQEVDQLKGGMQGELVVCLSTVPLLALLPRSMPSFKKRYPKVTLRIIEGGYPAVEERIRKGEADFYVGVAPHGTLGEDLAMETLFENTGIVLGRRGHPLSSATSIRDLADAEWAAMLISEVPGVEIIELFREQGLHEPRLGARVQSALGMMAVVGCSDMLGFVPRQWHELFPTKAALRQIHVKETLKTSAIALIKRASLPLTPAAEYFCDLLRRASVSYSAD